MRLADGELYLRLSGSERVFVTQTPDYPTDPPLETDYKLAEFYKRMTDAVERVRVEAARLERFGDGVRLLRRRNRLCAPDPGNPSAHTMPAQRTNFLARPSPRRARTRGCARKGSRDESRLPTQPTTDPRIVPAPAI